MSVVCGSKGGCPSILKCEDADRCLHPPALLTSNQISQWLRDYVAMMEANLGILQSSTIDGLYEGVVERVLEVRQYLKQSPSGERTSSPQPLQQQTTEYYKLLQSYDAVVKENEKLRALGDSSAPETKAPRVDLLDSAIDTLRAIADMGKKAGSEAAMQWLAHHGIPREEGGYVPGRGFTQETGKDVLICPNSLKGYAGQPCPRCGDGPCPVVNGEGDGR